MSILPIAIHIFNTISIKIPITYFTDLEQIVLKLTRSQGKNLNSFRNLEKGQSWITIPDTKLYYKVTTIKIVWYWNKNRHIDQWNSIQSPNINPSWSINI